jgi:hypothetical protein
MIIRPFAPTVLAWAASAAARLELCAPVPTMTGRPASTNFATPSIRCSSVSKGQSPIEPQ